MTRVAVCGAALADTAGVLGLEPVDEGAELVLLDLADAEAVRAASAIDPSVPRVVVAGDGQAELLKALGTGSFFVARSTQPAAIGPLVAAALPARPPLATRLAVVTGVVGGCGRTLLAVNLALRLAGRGPVLLLDLTGSGSAAWWLRVTPSPWSELEGLIDELAPEHLGVVAAERDGVRVVGSAGAMPSPRLAVAATRAAAGLADLVVVDAPAISDERTRALAELADRVLVIAPDDPASIAALAAIVPSEHWLIAARCRRDTLAGRPVLRALPDDGAAVRAAARGGGPVGGALGRAYDELAELLAIDASP